MPLDPSRQSSLYRHVPNALTGLRLVLAAAFFVLLSFYQYEGRGDPYLILVAFWVYVVALVTDFLDGYLARKWDVGSAFGRVVDPFADKILVLGTFIFFAGKNFIVPETVVPDHGAPGMVVKTLTGVAPGIVVILLARELLVTSLRAIGEGAGQNFGAVWAGKFKMGFQSGTILFILAYVTFRRTLADWNVDTYATIVRDVGVYGTAAITLYSGLAYVRRAVTMYQQGMVRSVE
ncbi:MAG TPA: CDP-alcohol phosphatidyltransferase family protein [Tepidisphaeraceae bacterium]|nr:CDP-alcohol phosphatidyltransferase family protein [Tepidisphaeraceae bacterium]